MIKSLLLCCCIAAACHVQAQNAAVLDWPDFRQIVLQKHPEARRAESNIRYAQASLLKANGGFDPKSFADFESKNFNGSSYFQTTEIGLKWPSLFGLEFKGAYLQANGAYLNPEHKLPKNGQALLGLNWTLGQGLFIDERRAGLRQARIGIVQANAERNAEINDLLIQAAKAYWNWVLADNQLTLYENSLAQAQTRFEALKESFRLGYKPAMDTVEAYIQVQTRNLDVNFGRVERQNAAQELSNYYWLSEKKAASPAQFGDSPQLPSMAYPELPATENEERITEARTQHPVLLYYQSKMQTLDVEQRMKREKRKPVLDLNYNMLGNGWSFTPFPDSKGGLSVLANNSKWGLQFSYPILNRKAKGDLQLTQVKRAQTDLDILQKQQEIESKIRQYFNDRNNFSRQIKLYESIIANRKILLEAEMERFRLGSGSVFLINTREQSLLDAQVKYYKLLAEYKKAEAGLLWAAGKL